MAEINNLGELLPISENNGKKAVNARYLHSFLESKQEFANWIKGRINKYDFVEGKDFETLYFDYQGNLLNIRHDNFIKSENQQVSKIEYALSIGMAKELSMLENNERGKQARKYFIACEENKRELSRKELLLMALQAEEDKERLALENEKQQKQIERLKPKADFAEKAFAMEGKVDIGQAAKILNLGYGRNTLFKKLREVGVFFANRNEPKQKYIDAGYFEMTEKPISRKNHPGFIVMVVTCTQKGLAYINHLFGGNPSDGKLARIR